MKEFIRLRNLFLARRNAAFDFVPTGKTFGLVGLLSLTTYTMSVECGHPQKFPLV